MTGPKDRVKILRVIGARAPGISPGVKSEVYPKAMPTTISLKDYTVSKAKHTSYQAKVRIGFNIAIVD